MDSESDESEKPRETVTLVLKTKRFEVEKQKLIDKSQYFAALLSGNYSECHRTEHIINYDISPILLQDFIDWIHNDELDTSATNYDFEFDHLLLLLELSILFTVENLEKDITDTLERHYMSPKYALNIWLLTQELNISTLRDLSLDVCLDRFNELPLGSIYELSRENFLKLIGNINLRSTKSYMLDIIHEWMNRHDDFTVSLDIIEKNKQAKILHSIISCEGPDNLKNENYIHCWDGNDFFEFASFNYPKDITDRSTGKKTLVGMQIIGRRCDLYLCGGEFGIGSGKFNKNVWRYSLISKKWYIQTVMPVERRHMIAVILENKLLLVGGVGRYRQKLRSVDIYDIYTDYVVGLLLIIIIVNEFILKNYLLSMKKIFVLIFALVFEQCIDTWTFGKEMPWDFTSVPEHSIMDKKLFIYGCTYIFTYLLDKNIWKRCKLTESIFRKSKTMSILMLKTMSCYIDVVNPDEMVLRAFTTTCDIEYCYCQIDLTEPLKYPRGFFEIWTDNVSFCILTVRGKHPTLLLGIDNNSYSKKLHLRNIPIQNPNKFSSFLSCHSPRKFFHLIHPAHLHMTNLDRI